MSKSEHSATPIRSRHARRPPLQLGLLIPHEALHRPASRMGIRSWRNDNTPSYSGSLTKRKAIGAMRSRIDYPPPLAGPRHENKDFEILSAPGNAGRASFIELNSTLPQVEYLNSGIAFSSSLVALNTA
jgi:hypothetical protein